MQYNAAIIANISAQEMFKHEAQKAIECTGVLSLFPSHQDMADNLCITFFTME